MSSVLTVTQVNTYLKSIIDGDYNLKRIYISGEISNFTNHYRSGHFYFTLKDSESAIKAIMFRSSASNVRFSPEDGMKVIVRGTISVFERDGTYQLYCDEIIPDGQGALSIAFEQLKKKLFEKGMFDDEHKKALPKYPERIGVITSPTGAAVHDILSVLERRFPYSTVIFEPVAVQGDGAAEQICAAIELFNLHRAADVIIVGRGGGSIEDLWAFNEEIVANAIYNSDIPIVSAVGHETDFTISDYVSDLRAPTPSAAAELVVPDYRELLYELDNNLDVLTDSVIEKLDDKKTECNEYEKLLFALSPKNAIENLQKEVEFTRSKLNGNIVARFAQYNSELSNYAARLEGTSPLKVLARGYSIASDSLGENIKSITDVNVSDKIKLRLSDGILNCSVDGIENI